MICERSMNRTTSLVIFSGKWREFFSAVWHASRRGGSQLGRTGGTEVPPVRTDYCSWSRSSRMSSATSPSMRMCQAPSCQIFSKGHLPP